MLAPTRLLFSCVVLAMLLAAVFAVSQPVQLVRPSLQHDGFEVVDESLISLNSLTGSVAFVAAVGPYHSGKSFLLNMLHGGTSGFALGPTTQPQTKGLWMITSDLKTPDNATIVFLDTEGFYGSEAAESYDAKIFAIATLLSSHLMFNSIKLIDQQAVDYLELLARRTQLFDLKNRLVATTTTTTSTTASDVASDVKLPLMLTGNDFPALTWVVEDFIQDLEGRSPTEWLQQFLAKRHRDHGLDGISHSLEQIFSHSLKCLTLYLPATALGKLRNLSQCDVADLTPEFLADVEKLRTRVFTDIKTKQTASGPLTGPAASSLLRFFVDTANKERFPELPSLWETWLLQRQNSALEDAIRLYTYRMDVALNTSVVLNEKEFYDRHKIAAEEAESLFKQLLFGYSKLYSGKLGAVSARFESVYEVKQARNLERIRELIANRRDVIYRQGETEFDSIDLPLPLAALTERCDAIQNDAQLVFKTSLSKFASVKAYTENFDGLKTDMMLHALRLFGNNRKKIEDLLKGAFNAALKSYDNAVRALAAIAVPAEKLKQIHDQASGNASALFVRQVSSLNLPWLLHERDYLANKALAEKEIRGAYKKFKRDNEAKAAKICNAAAEVYAAGMSNEAEAIQPFPDEENVLTNKISHFYQQADAAYKQSVSYLADTAAYTTASHWLKSKFEEVVKDRLDSNIQFLKAQLLPVFKCARSALEGDKCTFCLKSFWPWSYTADARSAALRCFDSHNRKTSTTISPSLRSKVITDWIATELSAQSLVVYHNFTKVMVALFCTVVVAVIAYTSRR